MASTALMDNMHVWAGNFQHNLTETITKMAWQDYIRIVIVIGGYCLLRPYLILLGGKFQAKDHERELNEGEMSSAAAMSPNSLRGKVQVPEDSDDEDGGESGGTTGTDWGRNARRRQRQLIRKILEAEEKLKAEEAEAEADSDKDIEEFLER